MFRTILSIHNQKKCNGVTPQFLAMENIFVYSEIFILSIYSEIFILGLHGDLIKRSFLDSALAHTNLSTIGTSTIFDVNNIKRSRYCLQVGICVIYKLFKEAYADTQSNVSLFSWLEERSKIRQMACYWRLILNFQIQILIFVRSVRTRNFLMNRKTLFYFLKWVFARDKYNYSRWATVYWFHLATLDQCCPDVFCNFMNGNFSFPKTNPLFSRIAVDQLHEQNNKVIEGKSGATSVINRKDKLALNRWTLTGPELAEIISPLENEYKPNDQPLPSTKVQHECSKAFQTDFYNGVQGLGRNFVSNPFLLENLTIINDTSKLFDGNIFYNIAKLDSIGFMQLKAFINDRLISCKKSINSKIALNHFILPNDEKAKNHMDKPLTNVLQHNS